MKNRDRQMTDQNHLYVPSSCYLETPETCHPRPEIQPSTSDTLVESIQIIFRNREWLCIFVETFLPLHMIIPEQLVQGTERIKDVMRVMEHRTISIWSEASSSIRRRFSLCWDMKSSHRFTNDSEDSEAQEFCPGTLNKEGKKRQPKRS